MESFTNGLYLCHQGPLIESCQPARVELDAPVDDDCVHVCLIHRIDQVGVYIVAGCQAYFSPDNENRDRSVEQPELIEA